MKKLLLVLLLVSAPAFAEWTRVGGNDILDSYADLATIRKKGNTVKMWVLSGYKAAQPFEGETFLSWKAQEEYDCEEERTRKIYISFHSGNMGGGKVVYSNADASGWEPVPPGSIVESLWKLACK